MFPYIGGYIVAHLPPPPHPGVFRPRHANQINQALYMDRATLEPLDGKIEEMRALLQEFVDAFYGNSAHPSDACAASSLARTRNGREEALLSAAKNADVRHFCMPATFA